jgi:hypothetical protein
MTATNCLDGGPHSHASCQTVVNQQDRPPTNVERRPAIAIHRLPPLQYGQFSRSRVFDRDVRNTKRFDDMVMEQDSATACDRSHRQFLLTRQAEVVYEEYIQRYVERSCDLVSDWNAASRKRQDNRVTEVEHPGECSRELPPSTRSILES